MKLRNGVTDHLSQSIQSSRGGGRAMDTHTQSFMSSRFGSDFSDVKIHTDSQAVDLNRKVNAKAFTTGRDIYFNEGQYQPNSFAGKQLLAHELTHVKQQQNISPVIQKQELGPGPRGGVSIHSPVVDELLTQVSDVHGSLAGRALLRSETELARTVFGNSIDYTRVRLIIGNLAAGTTAGNNIRLPEDFSIANEEHKQLLIHEMTHVWQFQHNGAGYITTSLLQQMHAGATRGNRNFAYDYRISAGNTFFEFAPEQQAFIVENYYAMLRDQQLIGAAGGMTRTYKSNHLDASGFNAVITAQQRSTEITTELPLHEPLIRQMSFTPFLSAVDLRLVRQRDVMILPPQQDILAPTSRDQQFLPTPNLFEVRF